MGYKTGVYIKPNGNLVLIEEVHKDKNKYIVIDGKTNDSVLCKALYPRKSDRPLAGWIAYSLDNLDWGPLTYLKRCEYLGEL